MHGNDHYDDAAGPAPMPTPQEEKVRLVGALEKLLVAVKYEEIRKSRAVIGRLGARTSPDTLLPQVTKFPTWVDLKGKESVPTSVHHAKVPFGFCCCLGAPADPARPR